MKFASSFRGERMNDQKLYAYALGYYYGRAEGSHNDPFSDDNEELQHLFKIGYDAGVSDYCGHAHGDEVNA